jgi:hypothetical protein
LTDTEQAFCIAAAIAASTRRKSMTRKNRKLVPTVFALSFAFTLWATSAQAEGELTFAAEVDSCVAAVNTHLDLGGADRVRHFVSNARRTGIGYVLTIETSVFFESAEKRYAAYCVARGGNVPLKFRIEETEA